MSLDSLEDVLHALERELRQRVEPSIWKYMVKKRLPGDVVQGDMSIPELVKEYRELRDLRRAGPAPAPPERQRELAPTEYLTLFSRALAEEINRDPLVTTFRETYLGGKLVPFKGINDWVRARAREGGTPTVYMEVPLGRDDKPLRNAGRRLTTRMLHFVAPPSIIMRVKTTRGGVLEHLRVVAEQLASPGGWPPAGVTTFVLTGKRYLVPRVIVTQVVVIGLGQSRIRLDVHPSVGPDEVRAIYAQERNEFEVPTLRRGKRSRAELVDFVEARPHLTWKELMNEWNHTYPDWDYTHDNNMLRDYHRARKEIGNG